MGIEIVWRDSYLTGIALIDQEHRELFRLGQRVLDAHANEDDSALRQHALALFRYVRTHFHREEAVMQRAGYPLAHSHRRSHDALMRRLSTVSDPGLSPEELANGVRQLVLEWIADHIAREDRSFAEFARADPSRLQMTLNDDEPR